VFAFLILTAANTQSAQAQDRAEDGTLGDRIAERLCYPDSAEKLDLSTEEAAQYASSFGMSGAYRDIQGAEGRADFTKKGPIAECRWWASVSQELFYCAKVSLRGAVLTKGRARLCF
jgi:hypothetical protein